MEITSLLFTIIVY